MNINNLVFFDKNGESYNFSQNSSGVWEGADYFLPVSTALYDVSNLFILEKVGTSYKFPTLAPGSTLRFKWRTAQFAKEFLLFTVSKEDENTDSTIFLNRVNSIDIAYTDLNPLGSSNLDLAYPLQVNIGFAPTDEVAYTRILDIYYETTSETTLIGSITFYGEGEDEDARFRVWLENFGIKFNREDALLLKDYDLKEGLPDWNKINQARKELLVNRDQIYPYIGTYKGLINLINILGYRDVLRVKEYWQDRDTQSAYYQKYAMVDITDLMTEGNLDSINLVDLNGQIKKGGKFKKTEFLALAYEFSVASDTYDDDGVPEVEFTTEFEVNEIFYKLNRLSTKLKQEMLPVNVIIKDIIGEFIYFHKFNLRNWSDVTYINSLEINDDYNVVINSPIAKTQLLQIRDIKTLYPKTVSIVPPSNTVELSQFPSITFNVSTTQPYQYSQKYPVSEIPALLTAISDYYQNLNNYEFQYHGQPNPMTSGDDIDGKVGCPVSLEAYVPDFTIAQLDGSKFEDFTGTHYTIGNIKYRNGYEIEWDITGPQGYVFNWRGGLLDLVKIPHILPHIGNYTIKSTVYDMQGGQNVSYLHATVITEEPVIQIFTKIQDKNRYDFKNLDNVTIGDLSSSPLYQPFANVIQAGVTSIDLPVHYLDWNTYSNNFGVGNPQREVEIYTNGIGFELIDDSDNHVAIQWGTGNSTFGQPTLGDYGLTTIEELVMNRMSDFSYVPDRINGFILDLPNMTNNFDTINFINFLDWNILNSYVVTPYTDADDLANQLNSANDDHVSQYRYVALNGKVHARAIEQDRGLHRILKVLTSTGNEFRIKTFCYPFGVYSRTLVDELNVQLSQIARRIDDDLLFLNAPFDDILEKTGETATSTTPSIISSSFTGPFTFTLNMRKEFESGAMIKAVNASDPTKWIEGTFTQNSEFNTLTLTVISSHGYGPSGTPVSEWRFEYSNPNSTEPAIYANANNMNYWINKGFIEFTSSLSGPSSTPTIAVRGFLPSNHDQNTFNLTNLKIGADGLTVPLEHPVFAAISNIDSKKECIWTLKHVGEEIAKIKSTSFFIWRFDEPGAYSLTVDVTDVNNNVFSLTRDFFTANTKSIPEYKKYVTDSLNRRKAKM
jgi:hypothetical protein